MGELSADAHYRRYLSYMCTFKKAITLETIPAVRQIANEVHCISVGSALLFFLSKRLRVYYSHRSSTTAATPAPINVYLHIAYMHKYTFHSAMSAIGSARRPDVSFSAVYRCGTRIIVDFTRDVPSFILRPDFYILPSPSQRKFFCMLPLP